MATGSFSSGQLLSALIDWIEPIYGNREASSIAGLILEKSLKKNPGKFWSGELVRLTGEEIAVVNTILKRLAKHEPIQYILGESYFYDRWFVVNPAVLIPRHETEELCRLIIEENPGKELRILDIGTGSGCIAAILALHMNSPVVYGWDIHKNGLAVAAGNAQKFGTVIKFEQQNIFQDRAIGEKFNIIVSNPPYVTAEDKISMNKNILDFEPAEALFVPDDDPLKFYKRILSLKNELLLKDGKIYFEINESFGKEMEELMIYNGLAEVRIIRDIHGKDRFAFGRLME